MAAVLLGVASLSAMVGVVLGLTLLIAAWLHARLSGRPF
jgi:hypothetical protein